MAKAKERKELFVIREPSGRPSRAVADAVKPCSPAEVRRLRDAALANMHDEAWGWEIGRLFLQGKISADEFEAGKRWRRLVEAWRQATGMPKPSPKALAMFSGPRSEPADPDSDEGQKEIARARELTTAMMESHAVLVSFGLLAENAVRRTCESDFAPEGQEGLNQLVRGLGSLSVLWGLTQGSRNGRT
jgi:hypothetical protein